MNKITCPLCQSINTRLVESIKTVDIEEAYLRHFGVTTNFKTNEISYMICSNCSIGFFDPMAAGDEHLYEQLQRFDWYYMDDKPEFELAKKYLPITGNVLEVGSGRAAFASEIGVARYTGLEFNDMAIEKAVSVGIKLLKESVEVHASRNLNQYDAVVSFQVLEHVSSPAKFIKGCVDCLRPGGILILAVPSRDSFAGGAANSYLDMPPHHVTHWSEDTMRKIGELYALKVISVEHEPVAEYHLSWAQQILWEKRLRHLLGMKLLLLDASFSAKLFSKIASVMTKIAPISVNEVKGHTVVAVYMRTE
jgi:SAM-dependent methyltransferase